MGKIFGITRTLCRPAHKILKQGSSASLDAFAQEKQNFDEEQLKLIQKILDNEKSGEIDLEKLKTALA